MRFSFLLVSIGLPIALAATDFGVADKTKQYQMTYSQTTYPTILNFCKTLRLACVDYNGPSGYHHTLTCDINQTGNDILAFCGGVKKLPNGEFGKKGSPVVNFTTAVVANMKDVKITDKPTGSKSLVVAKKALKKKSPKSKSTSTVTPPARSTAIVKKHTKSKAVKGKAAEVKKEKGKVGGKKRTVVKAKKVAVSCSK